MASLIFDALFQTSLQLLGGTGLDVCVLMPNHCTITRFGFRGRRIYGVECGIFFNHVPLGQTTLRVGRVSV